MDKGKIFISSTIYDFQDLRSALKYWLTEMGYEVYLSENNDFPRDAADNSYQTCLSTIQKCDWFILLIGNRNGGKYLDPKTNESISITRAEYRSAYQLFIEGKVKKIITFIRNNVWIAKEERKGIIKAVDKENDGENLIQIVKEAPSKNADDPSEIFAFIDEVKRTQEMGEANNGHAPYPCGNWVNIFDSFSDIVDTLRVELNLSRNVSSLIWAVNITEEIKLNLKKLVVKNSQGSFGLFSRITSIRDKCIAQLKANGKRSVILSVKECRVILGTFISAISLRAYFLKECLLTGQFLRFNSITNKFDTTIFSKNLSLLADLIDRNNEQGEFFNSTRSSLFIETDRYRSDSTEELTIEYTKIAPILIEHDQLSNILTLSLYVLAQLNSEKQIKEPKLYPIRLYENFEVPEESKALFDSYDEFYGKEITDEDLDKLAAMWEGNSK